jgi:hypothetical protein
VIIRPDAYQDLLACSNTEEVRSFLTLYRADEMAAESPALPPMKPKA